jgi:DNA-binding MarR family transcriptional regulator
MDEGRSVRQGLSFLVGRVYYNYVALLSVHLAKTGLGEHLIPGMGNILFVLFEEDDLPMKAITERASIAASTLTGMVKRMEAAGLVERRRDGADGRSVRLALTPLGRSLRPRCLELAERMEGFLNAGLSGGEQEMLRELLSRVAGNIQTSLQQQRGAEA